MVVWKCDSHTLYERVGSIEDAIVRPAMRSYTEALQRLHHTPRPRPYAPCSMFAAAITPVVAGEFELGELSSVRSDIPPKAA